MRRQNVRLGEALRNPVNRLQLIRSPFERRSDSAAVSAGGLTRRRWLSLLALLASADARASRRSLAPQRSRAPLSLLPRRVARASTVFALLGPELVGRRASSTSLLLSGRKNGPISLNALRACCGKPPRNGRRRYPDIGCDEDGLRKLFRQFSFPGGVDFGTPESALESPKALRPSACKAGGVDLAPGATADGCLAEAIRERLRELLVPPRSLGRREYKSKLVDH